MPGEKSVSQKCARVLLYALHQWRILLRVAGITAFSSTLTALQPWPLKILVDYGLGGVALPAPARELLDAVGVTPTPVGLVVAAAAASLSLFAIGAVAGAGLAWAWALAGRRMTYELAAGLFRQLQRLSLAFHSRQTVGDSLNPLTDDVWCARTVTESLMIAPVRNVLTLATLGALAWTLDPLLTVVSLTFVPAMAGGAYMLGRRVQARTREQREARSRLFALVQQTMAALPVVRAFGRDNRSEFLQLSKDAPVLILDEPTAALDAETEAALVLDALDRLARYRTTFVIAHRLSTVRKADRIVLEAGRVVQTGTHDELVRCGGPYASALAAQLGDQPDLGGRRGRRTARSRSPPPRRSCSGKPQSRPPSA